MKSSPFVIGIILLFSCAAYAQEHKPTWQFLDDRRYSSFDLLTTRSGLFALDNTGFKALIRYDSGHLAESYEFNGTITSVIIRDENTAFFSVKGDGIYQASNKWKNFTKIFHHTNPNLLAVFGTTLFSNFDSIFYYCEDGITFHQAGGILPTDLIVATDAFSSQTGVAITAKKIYRSLDAGKNWSMVMDGLTGMNSIYTDRTHKIIYVGGSKLMKSLDSGKTWQTVTNIFYDLSGPVLGVRDCSGAFYIASDPVKHGVIYRSTDQGRFFQEAGSGLPSLIHLKKGVVADRGSTFFWLDTIGLVYYVRDGIDSVITDSVRNRIVIGVESDVRYSLCTNLPPTSFAVSLVFDQCTGIILDSLKQVKPVPQFSVTFKPGLIKDTTISFAFTFKANRPGSDTAHYRLKFHSPLTGNIEQVFFDVTGFGNDGNPEILFSSPQLLYPSIYVDSTYKLSTVISNTGCDTLRIDTIFSTDQSIFIPESKHFPLTILPGKNITYAVNFTPHSEGEYLESLQIETNIGIRYLPLSGKGIVKTKARTPEIPGDNGINIYPNPANNLLTIRSLHPLPEKILIRDLLGRTVMSIVTNKDLASTFNIHALLNGFYIIDIDGKFIKIFIEH